MRAVLIGVLLVAMALHARPVGAAIAGVDERPGSEVPLTATVTVDDGRRVALRELLDRRTPTLLVLAYFRCPMLCDQIIGSLVRTLPAMRIATGRDYRVLVLSIDPKDTPATATEKGNEMLGPLASFERARWHFAIGDRGSAKRIADAVGFRYQYDAATDQFAHPAVVIALTTSGRVARYVYGVTFPPEVLASAVGDAAAGRELRTIDRVLLTCFHYVPSLRRHAAAVAWVLRGGTSLLFAAVGLSLVLLVRRQRREPRDA